MVLASNGVSFLIGTTFATSASMHTNAEQEWLPNQNYPSPIHPQECPICPEAVSKECSICPPPIECLEEANIQQSTSSQRTNNLFPLVVDRFAVGMAHVSQANFTDKFDIGAPIDSPMHEGESGVIIIYSTESAMPNKRRKQAPTNSELLSPEEATENCDHMNVISTYHEGKHRRQCLAIVPQYESYHIQKWLRVPEDGPGSSHYPLRMVPRGKSMQGTEAFSPPKHDKHTKRSWKMLETYFDTLDDVIAELTPIVRRIAIDNTIVVMVCNFGQSQLLVNFACSAKAKGIDISNVLVFATDEETKELAESAGLNAYFEKRNFGNMPTKAAKTYGDGTFTTMMLSKVMCVHMASMIKVDFLFQDVDVLWFRNPLPFFQNKTSVIAGFDAYFQDDGGRSARFAPYCANSGFYFLRHNERTQYFLTSFLMQSDMILRSFSHQSAMISVLAEHSSLFGLRVKTLGHAEFPSGFIYHRKKGKGRWGNYFMDLYDGKHNPYVFHMSWTENKSNKILYYRQLDQWYLQDQCMDTELSKIPLEPDSTFMDTCCSAEPLFSCHYRDKPSSRPCKDAPPIEKNGLSYW